MSPTIQFRNTVDDLIHLNSFILRGRSLRLGVGFLLLIYLCVSMALVNGNDTGWFTLGVLAFVILFVAITYRFFWRAGFAARIFGCTTSPKPSR